MLEIQITTANKPYHRLLGYRLWRIGEFSDPPFIHPSTPRLRWVSRIYYGCQVMSTRTGMSFLTGIVKRDGGSILKSASVAGMVPVM